MASFAEINANRQGANYTGAKNLMDREKSIRDRRQRAMEGMHSSFQNVMDMGLRAKEGRLDREASAREAALQSETSLNVAQMQKDVGDERNKIDREQLVEDIRAADMADTLARELPDIERKVEQALTEWYQENYADIDHDRAVQLAKIEAELEVDKILLQYRLGNESEFSAGIEYLRLADNIGVPMFGDKYQPFADLGNGFPPGLDNETIEEIRFALIEQANVEFEGDELEKVLKTIDNQMRLLQSEAEKEASDGGSIFKKREPNLVPPTPRFIRDVEEQRTVEPTEVTEGVVENTKIVPPPIALPETAVPAQAQAAQESKAQELYGESYDQLDDYKKARVDLAILRDLQGKR